MADLTLPLDVGATRPHLYFQGEYSDPQWLHLFYTLYDDAYQYLVTNTIEPLNQGHQSKLLEFDYFQEIDYVILRCD